METPPARLTAPAQAAWWFAAACLLGLVLGVLYSFLRPLRLRKPALADGIFVLGLFYGWLYLGFKICRGDLRPGCTVGLFGGIILWEMTLGKGLRPLFAAVWHF